MSHDIDPLQSAQCRNTNRRTHIVGENKEGRTVRNQTPVVTHSCDDCAHSMLTDTKMQITSGVVVLLERTIFLHHCFGGRSQIRRTPNEIRNIGKQGFEHFASGITSSISLFRSKFWQELLEICRKLLR